MLFISNYYFTFLIISCFRTFNRFISIPLTYKGFWFFSTITEFLRTLSLSRSKTVFSIDPGSEGIFFLTEGESALNSTTIFVFLAAEGLPYLTRKVATDFDFLATTGDSIFFRTKLEIYSFSLLYCFSSALKMGFFNTFKSNIFLLLILYRYSSERSYSLFSISARCSF